MKGIYRLAIMLAVVGALTVPAAGAAYAHVCTNTAKPVGAGSAGDATINVVTGEFDASGVTINEHSGRPQGGFVTITAVDGDGNELGTVDTFAQTTLPEAARNAGPGDDPCDGVGIDDAEACIAP